MIKKALRIVKIVIVVAALVALEIAVMEWLVMLDSAGAVS